MPLPFHLNRSSKVHSSDEVHLLFPLTSEPHSDYLIVIKVWFVKLSCNSLNFIFIAKINFTDVNYDFNFDPDIIANVSCTIMFLMQSTNSSYQFAKET